MTYGQQVLDDLRPETRELRKMIPDVYQGFGALHGAAFAAGVLDTKTKELIALAISVALRACHRGQHPVRRMHRIPCTRRSQERCHP